MSGVNLQRQLRPVNAKQRRSSYILKIGRRFVDILRLFGACGKTYWTKCRYRSLYSNKDSSAAVEGNPGVFLPVKAKIKVEKEVKEEGFHAGMGLPPTSWKERFKFLSKSRKRYLWPTQRIPLERYCQLHTKLEIHMVGKTWSIGKAKVSDPCVSWSGVTLIEFS